MHNTSYTRLPSKRAYLINMGRLLVTAHGKQAYYSPEQIEAAHRKSTWANVLPKSQYAKRGSYFFKKLSGCAIVAAMSVFSARADFDKHMLFMGTASNYNETRTGILSEVLPEAAIESFDFLSSTLDVSWLEIGESVGAVAEGTGEVLGGFFEVILEGIGGIFG